MFYVYALVAWLAFLATAIANGAFREYTLKPRLGESKARLISPLLLGAVIGVEIAIFMMLAADDQTTVELLALGAGWVVLSVAFEFGFGHYVQHDPWSELLAQYNVFAGNLWPVVLLVELLTPALIGS